MLYLCRVGRDEYIYIMYVNKKAKPLAIESFIFAGYVPSSFFYRCV